MTKWQWSLILALTKCCVYLMAKERGIPLTHPVFFNKEQGTKDAEIMVEALDRGMKEVETEESRIN